MSKKPIMLDESKPYGRTLGDDNVSFKQSGADFDSRKRLIAGSKNSAPALISMEIEKIAAKPVFEDMHIHALKRHAAELYEKLTEEGVEFVEPEPGRGLQERLITFLNAHQ